MIILNYRRVYLLNRLVENAPYPITVQQLSKELDCSERTIRYELDIVDDWLKRYTITNLIRKSNSGIQLELHQADKDIINNQLSSLSIVTYECNRQERIQIVSLLLLTSQKPLTISRLQSLFSLSRGTVLKDLEMIEIFLNKFSIHLKRKQRKGIWLEANELHLRQALTNLNKSLDTNLVQIIAREIDDGSYKQKIQFPKSMPGILHALDIERVQEVVDPLLRLLDVALSDEGRMTLYLHISMVLIRTKSNRPINMDTGFSEVYSKKEYKISEIITKQIEKTFEVELPEEETAYIALHILGNQNAPLLPMNGGEQIDQKLVSIVAQMTLHVEKLLQVHFQHKKKLNQGLLLHIQPAIYRAKYGLVMENTLVREVKEEYKRVFDAVRIAILPLEQTYRITFSDKEIAYIAMHYGGKMYQKPDRHQEPLSIILVCSSGLGTANLLKSRIESLFTNITIVRVLSQKLFLEQSVWDANLIISTITLPMTDIPQLKVHPLLPEKDFRRLSMYLTVKEPSMPSAEQLYESVWPIIREHCIVETPKQLTEKMIKAFQKIMGKNKIGYDWTDEASKHILEKEMIQLSVQVTNWRKAILAGVKPLERYGLDTELYGQEIVSIMEKQGPYMAVAPGIMLAHGSKKEIPSFALSFTRLDPPIAFGHKDNDPISLLFVFAAPDDNEHLTVLQKLLEPLLKKENRKALCAARTPEEVLKVIEMKNSDDLAIQEE